MGGWEVWGGVGVGGGGLNLTSSAAEGAAPWNILLGSS